MSKSLSEIIQAIRKQKGKDNQKSLAAKVGKKPQWINAIENGELPSLELLIQLHEALLPEGSQTPEEELSLWLLKWLEESISRRRDSLGTAGNSGLAAVSKLYDQSDKVRKASVPAGSLPTLQNFPHAFGDFVIIFGDRRESPPKTRGDIFADSFAVTDIMGMAPLIEKIGKADIWSDKLFVLLREDELREEFGNKNLILIGSPAVNLASRAVNKFCTFRFAIPEEARIFDEQLRSTPELNDRTRLEIFWKMASEWQGKAGQAEIKTAKYKSEYAKDKIKAEEIDGLAQKVAGMLNDHTAKEMKNFFRLAGFVDIADATNHGTVIRQDNDFGIISLSKNPYADSENYFCILVAGIHAPGTYHGVNMLATDGFVDHPLGGVFEVTLDQHAAWKTRITRARSNWQTSGYTVNKLLLNLSNTESSSVFKSMPRTQIDDLISFVQRFAA